MAEQTCKDCNGQLIELYVSDWGTNEPDERPCSTCQGTGVIERTGPYRLTDGTWSDGIDRTHRINRDEFADANPNRVTVICQENIDGRWLPESWVYRGYSWLHDGALTHAEAVAYADKHARTTKNGASRG